MTLQLREIMHMTHKPIPRTFLSEKRHQKTTIINRVPHDRSPFRLDRTEKHNRIARSVPNYSTETRSQGVSHPSNTIVYWSGTCLCIYRRGIFIIIWSAIVNSAFHFAGIREGWPLSTIKCILSCLFFPWYSLSWPVSLLHQYLK